MLFNFSVPTFTFLLAAIKFFNPVAVSLKALVSVIIFSTDFFDTPSLFNDAINLLLTFWLNPGKTILFFLTTSSAEYVNSAISFDKLAGSLSACAAPLVSLDISLIESSMFLEASLAKIFTADFLPSSFCIPSNNSCVLLLLDLKGFAINLSTHLSNILSLYARSLPFWTISLPIFPPPTIKGTIGKANSAPNFNLFSSCLFDSSPPSSLAVLSNPVGKKSK